MLSTFLIFILILLNFIIRIRFYLVNLIFRVWLNKIKNLGLFKVIKRVNIYICGSHRKHGAQALFMAVSHIDAHELLILNHDMR